MVRDTINSMSAFFRIEGIFIFLIVLLVAVSFSPILFFGRAFFDEEQIGFYYPHSFFYQKALAEGTSLQWNNGYYAGISVPFDQFVSAYFPLNRFLFSVFSFLTAHHLSIVIGVLLGCLFAYFFGREYGLRRSASFVLSSSYLLSTTFGWLDIGTLAAWSFFMIPALFLSIARVSRGGSLFIWTFIGGVSLGIGFLAGFVQIAFYGYATAAVFALYCMCFQRETKWRMLFSFGVMTMLGVLFSLPQTVPSLVLVGDSIRTATYAAQKFSTPGIPGLVAFFLPEYMKVHLFGEVVIGGSHGGFYLGALALFAAILGTLLWRNRIHTFFLLLSIGIFLTAFHIPPFSWLNDFLPPFSRFSSSFRWTIVAAWPFAALAGWGYHHLLSPGNVTEKEKRITRFLFWAVVALFLIIAVAGVALIIFKRSPDLQNYFLDWYLQGKHLSFPREHYANVLRVKIEEAGALFSLSDWRVLMPLFLLPLALLLIKYFREGRLGSQAFTRLSLILVSVDVLMVPAALWDRAFFPSSVLAEKPAIVRAIEGRESNFESFRIAGFMIGQSVFEEVTSKRILAPNPPQQ